MKKVFLISSLVALLGLAFSFGSTAGVVFEINPTVVGLVFAVGALVASKPLGALGTGIDVSDIATALGQYMSVPKTAAELWRRLFNGIELAPYLKKISGQTGTYSGITSSTSELMQPWQSGFQKKGVTTFVPYVNTVYRSKIDFLLENIDDVVGSWITFLSDETKERKDWPLVKYIVEFELLPKMLEEMNDAMCRGVYAAPATGIAGASIATMNGFQKIITAEILATNLTPIVVGSASATTGLDRFETFADGIDTKYSNKGGVILCSKAMERYYKTDYRATFGSTNDMASKNNTKLDNYNIEIVGLEGWGSSQRMLFAQSGNLIHMFDKVFQPNQFQVQQDKRDVVLFADWHCGVGFNSLQGVFVSDQV